MSIDSSTDIIIGFIVLSFNMAASVFVNWNSREAANQLYIY